MSCVPLYDFAKISILKVNSILCIMYVFCIGELSCQGFNKKFTYSNYIYPKFTSLYSLENITWAFGSVTDTTTGEDYLMINKVDGNGKLLLYSVFKESATRNWFNQGIAYFEGSLLTVTNDPYLSSAIVSYDIENNCFKEVLTIESVEKNFKFFASYDLIQDNNKDLIIASATSSDNVNSNRSFIQINKISPAGINKWTYTYVIPNYSLFPLASLVLPNNDIIISCHRQADIYNVHSTNSLNPLFLHLSSDGAFQKVVVVNKVMYSINDFKIDKDSNYICATSDTVHTNRPDFLNSVPMVASISPTGFINWAIDLADRRISYNSFEEMTKIKYGEENNLYYVSGMGRFINDEGNSSSEVNTILACFNDKGEAYWIHRIKNGFGETNDYCYDMYKGNRTILLAGGTRSVNEKYKQIEDASFIVKLNNDGCVLVDCRDYHSDSAFLNLYTAPNPVKDYLFVFSRESEPINITLVDIKGIEIYQKQQKFIEGVLRIPVADFAPGIYFLSANVPDSNKKYATKIVIE